MKGVKRNWLRAYFFTSIGLSAALAAFAYGVAVGTYKVFPYQFLEKAAAAARDWAQYPRHYARLRPDKFLAPTPHDARNFAGHNSEGAYGGVTFVDGFFNDSLGMRLLDMDGTVMHEWRVSFNGIWPDAAHIDQTLHDWDTQIHGAILYPNGDVVFNFQYAGLVRIDKCSSTKWKLPYQTHHSVFQDVDGNLWVPSRRLREEPIEYLPNLPLPFQEEFALKVSPDGEILSEISILDAILQSKYEGVLFANGAHDSVLSVPLDGDFTHLNDIKILEAPAAEAFPLFAEGDILVSLRNLNLLLVLDSETTAIKWSRTGPFLRQHDPDFLPNGKISVFDNRRDSVGGAAFGGSRILQIDPVSGENFVRYPRAGDEPFYTATMGDHQYFPNGNVLITESKAGNAFEVTPSGEIVWSFVNKWDHESVALIGGAIRYPTPYARSIQAEECQ